MKFATGSLRLAAATILLAPAVCSAAMTQRGRPAEAQLTQACTRPAGTARSETQQPLADARRASVHRWLPQAMPAATGGAETAGDRVPDPLLLAGGPPLVNSFKKALEGLAQPFQPKPPAGEATDPISLETPATPTPRLYTAMARLAENRNSPLEAEQHYRKALQLNPRYLDALIGYARLMDRQGRWEEAAQLYRKAVEVAPDNPSVYNDLGLCLARRRMWQPSLAALERAVQLDPRNPRYRNNIATVLVALGRIEEARAHLLAVHSEAVTDYNLGYMMQKKGDRAAAVRLFSQALEKDPSLEAARQWLIHLAQSRPPGSGENQTANPSIATRRSSPPVAPRRSTAPMGFTPQAPGPAYGGNVRPMAADNQPATGRLRPQATGQRARANPAQPRPGPPRNHSPLNPPVQPSRQPIPPAAVPPSNHPAAEPFSAPTAPSPPPIRSLPAVR